jgi:signal transduction histidine kinase/pSer/pThr/pTyr-binding forkhead associated (FHA) protein
MKDHFMVREAASATVPNLIVTSELHGDKVVPVNKPVVTIGRSIDRDIILVDRKVSSQHAEVRKTGNIYTIRDLASTNGTFVNGGRVSEAVLHLGDEITVGSTLIIFTDKSSFEKTAKIVLSPSDSAILGASPAQAQQPHSRGMLEIPLVDIEKRFFQGLDETKAPLDVTQKLNILYRLSSELNNILDVDQLLERLTDLILEVIACDRAFVILARDGKLIPKVIRKKAGVKDHKGLSISATIMNQVLKEGHAIITQDAQDDERFSGGDSIAFYQIRSALSVPLKAKEHVLGIVHLDKLSIAAPFKEEDLQLLALICNQAASNLANAQLFEELRVTNAELRLAKEEILRWNLELEQKVEERTRELANKTEEVLRLNEQKDELMGMVAHDLRTPITSILGFSDVILQHLDMAADKARVQDDVRIVGRIAAEMSDLLNDLLDVSKIEAGKITIQREMRPIEPLVQECFQTYVFLTEPKNLKIVLDTHRNLPPVSHDPRRIGQVLNNLLNNAVKFSRPGDQITIGAHQVGNAIEISVTDTGQGIAPEEVRKIFQRFEQTSTQAVNGERGSGLGLAIAKKLVELHGGRIWVESRKGVGSKFTFSLPLDEPPTSRFDPDDRKKLAKTAPPPLQAGGTHAGDTIH